MTRPYRPSNGDAGMWFEARWCMRCATGGAMIGIRQWKRAGLMLTAETAGHIERAISEQYNQKPDLLSCPWRVSWFLQEDWGGDWFEIEQEAARYLLPWMSRSGGNDRESTREGEGGKGGSEK